MSINIFDFHSTLSDPEFLVLVRNQAKYKERSQLTHDSVHEPLLKKEPFKSIWCLLLGDSMLERLKTTGTHTKLGQGEFPHIFNAGVGGDRIQNVLYRLDTKGLYYDLRLHGVKYAILHMGTNDLRPKRGLSAGALEQYALVLEAVHRAAPGVKILVTGLMPRKDVDQVFIHRSNLDLQQLVREYNEMTEQKTGRKVLFVLFRSQMLQMSTTPLNSAYTYPLLQSIICLHIRLSFPVI